MGEVATIARLETLLSLYNKGFQSPVIDQTIEKLVRLETDRIQIELKRLSARLHAFEEQYEMKSDLFYAQFMAGKTVDDADFVEWSVFWEMYQAELARLAELGERDA